MLAVHPSTPANSVRELIALARSKPLAFASAGNGTAMHLSGELFKLKAGLDLQHVPYKGSGPAVTDLMGGQVPVAFVDLSSALPHIRAGRVRALAVAGGKRTITAPEIPTIAESGVPGYDAVGWFGLFAPAGTPAAIISKLNADMNRLIKDKQVTDVLNNAGLTPVGGSIDDMRKLLTEDHERWAAVIKITGTKID